MKLRKQLLSMKFKSIQLKKLVVFAIILFSLSSCNNDNEISAIKVPKSNFGKIITKNNILKNWHLKDIEIDSLPGISLERSYREVLKTKKGRQIIVALIDTEVDINHKSLKNNIWRNTSETPNNNIDDDKNGFIDDVNGWNFLGNEKGESNKFVNFEYTRILKKLSPKFSEAKKINPEDSTSYKLYLRAKQRHARRLKYDLTEKKNYDNLFAIYFKAKEKLSKYFINKSYNVKSLDSIKKITKGSIDDIHFLILIDCLNNGIDDEYVIEKKFLANERINKLLNIDFNDRLIQGDNSEDILDIKYGNNVLTNNIDILDHGTKMAGIVNGVSLKDEIKIMPLNISAFGDEHDKDISLAIKYAVDNGAKVINMSFGKEFSLHKEWVFDAFKYAEKNNVLIVASAGNYNYDLNNVNDYYPNDNLNNAKEVSDNFLLVGGSSYNINKNFKNKSSSYGNIDVDVFAPGDEIYTTIPNGKFTNNSGGTSSASAITSGVAALLYSYYPKLTASEVKHILMDSGLEYDIEVSTPTNEDKKKTTPFNQLSKSGKVINAYNALIMADSISRKK